MLCYSMSSDSAHYTTKSTVLPKCLMWPDRRANASTVECSGIVIDNSQQMSMSPCVTSAARDEFVCACVWCFRSWLVMSEWTMRWIRLFCFHGNTISIKSVWRCLLISAFSIPQQKYNKRATTNRKIIALLALYLLYSYNLVTGHTAGAMTIHISCWTTWQHLLSLCSSKASWNPIL